MATEDNLTGLPSCKPIYHSRNVCSNLSKLLRQTNDGYFGLIPSKTLYPSHYYSAGILRIRFIRSLHYRLSVDSYSVNLCDELCTFVHPSILSGMGSNSSGYGAESRNRTDDLRVTNALLYRLSYSGTAAECTRAPLQIESELQSSPHGKHSIRQRDFLIGLKLDKTRRSDSTPERFRRSTKDSQPYEWKKTWV
jgi:hypothetical protein